MGTLRLSFRAALFLTAAQFLCCVNDNRSQAPVVIPHTPKESAGTGVRNLLSLEQLYRLVTDRNDSIFIDFSSISRLLDGTRIKPANVYGMCLLGPFPFASSEGGFSFKRFRISVPVREGFARLPLEELYHQNNSEEWTSNGTVVVRLELSLKNLGDDRRLGESDLFVRFAKTKLGFRKLPAIIEGPLVNLVTSDCVDSCIISLRTDVPAWATVRMRDGTLYQSPVRSVRHEIGVSSLRTGLRSGYQILIDNTPATPFYSLSKAPAKGAGSVVFAFTGESREGISGAERFMGVNADIVSRLLAVADARQVRFCCFSGDFVNGFTTQRRDYDVQVNAFKQALAPLWNHCPVFTAMGNFEFPLKRYQDSTENHLVFDNWPYATQSSEAIFADAFVNPENAPAPSDGRRPSYRENLYSFSVGPVRIICCNNEYWYSSQAKKYGGAPAGYFLDDQLGWIHKELAAAEEDPLVRYVFLMAQLPVFPCAGRTANALWYNGDNSVRAFDRDETSGALAPARRGILEVRDELVRTVSHFKKVAAFLTSGEAAYHRVFINNGVPVGNTQSDDANHNNIICEADESCLPLGDLDNGVWYITSGGAGAPYQTETETPWNSYWKHQRTSSSGFTDGYFYSVQENICIFEADSAKVSMKVYNPQGEVIDSVGNLMAGKQSAY